MTGQSLSATTQGVRGENPLAPFCIFRRSGEVFHALVCESVLENLKISLLTHVKRFLDFSRNIVYVYIDILTYKYAYICMNIYIEKYVNGYKGLYRRVDRCKVEWQDE